VLTARVSEDLEDTDTRKQFPADQVSVTVSPAGQGRFQISATGNPSAPETVESGFYQSNVIIYSGSESFTVPLFAYLAPRSGCRALFAFLLLLAGAIFGLSVKWITEALSSLAAARWRYEALRRSLGGGLNTLPAPVAAQLDELGNRITRQDTNDLDKDFGAFEGSLGQLRVFSTTVESIMTEIQLHERLRDELRYEDEATGDLDPDFIDTVARAERDQIERIRSIEWPWKDPDSVLREAQDLARYCHIITLALDDIRRNDSPEIAMQALGLFRRGQFKDGDDLYRNPTKALPTPQEPKVASKAQATRRRRGPRPYLGDAEIRYISPLASLFSGGGFLQWIVGKPRAMAAAASVLVVALVGLELQYLNDNAFAGSLGNWLKLFLWAAIIELSGVSVLDVVGRLGESRGAPSIGPRR
jgi:hypothetical protein